MSGGEKSYAQMCLIASLWENMNPPFRALDEWDVFLDALNRKNISSKLLEFGLTKLVSGNSPMFLSLIFILFYVCRIISLYSSPLKVRQILLATRVNSIE